MPRIDAFTQVPNDWARDEQLSYKARGLLLTLTSHKEGYETSVDDLAKKSPKEGRDAIMTGLAELRRYGYLGQARYRDDEGKFRWVYELRDPANMLHVPVDNPERISRPPGTSKRGARSDKPTATESDSPTANKNTIQNTLGTQVPSVRENPAPVDSVPFYRADRGAHLPERFVFVEACDEPTRRHRYSSTMHKCVDCDRVPTTREAAAFTTAAIAARLDQSMPNPAGTEAAGARPAAAAGSPIEGAHA